MPRHSATCSRSSASRPGTPCCGMRRRDRRRDRALSGLRPRPAAMRGPRRRRRARRRPREARSAARHRRRWPGARSAFGTATVSSIVRAPRAPRTLRVSSAAQTPPNIPVLDDITAAGLFRTGDSTSGRDAQSSAFLRTPGIDELYSGVEISTASASSSAALKSLDGGRLVAREVVVGVVRRDLLEPVVQLDVDAVGRGRGSAPEEVRVVGPLPEAAADREDLHLYA